MSNYEYSPSAYYPYHPQTDRLVERFNATLCKGLSMYVSSHQKDWDKNLPLVLFAYRVSPNATTGKSPFYLLYGHEPRLPLDVTSLLPDSKVSSSLAELCARIVSNLEGSQKIIESNTQLAQQRMKLQYDKHAAPVTFDIRSKVWVYMPKNRKNLSKKLAHNYHSPYRLTAKLSPVYFKLRTKNNRPVKLPVRANRMKLYYDPSERPITAPHPAPTLPDLPDADLPPGSFEIIEPVEPVVQQNGDPTAVSTEPTITRPEDTFTQAQIVPFSRFKPRGLT